MKKAFIWVSGLSFIDKQKLLMARNLFGFLAKNKPVWVSGKTKNIPGANWLKLCGDGVKVSTAGVWKLEAETLQAGDLDVMVKHWWWTTVMQGSRSGDQEALFRDALPAPYGEAPRKGGVKKACSTYSPTGQPRPVINAEKED